MIEIDGSLLEGGGQILRITLGLSCLCRIPVKIIKIRAGRTKPGLAAQHLKGVELLKKMCDARTRGDKMGSTEIEFIPNSIRGGNYYADTQTAGSIALLLQIALPVAFFADAPIKFSLKGGTNADMAPQIDFITEIFRPNLEKFGASFDFDLIKRGYFPKGGGHIEVNTQPVKYFDSVNMTNFGNVSNVFGWSFVTKNIPIKIGHDMASGVKSVLEKCTPNRAINIEVYKEAPEMTISDCSGIIIGCKTTTGCLIGGSALGNRKDDPFQSGKNAGNEIFKAISVQACVDEHVQDQLIIFMALAKGVSRIRTGPLTLHTKTAIFVVEKLMPVKFSIIEDGTTFVIECEGIGMENSNLK